LWANLVLSTAKTVETSAGHDPSAFCPFNQNLVKKHNIMAKQKGIIKLEGTLGDITFLKSRDGFLVRQKSGVSATRIANDPAFQRTRENGAEFGRAGKGGRLLRAAFRSLLQNVADSRMVSRLHREMTLAVQADETNPRGMRNIMDGEAGLLEGFEFNSNAKLNTTLYAPYTPAINRVSGECSITIPSFIPGQLLMAPSGSTHFRIRFSAAEIDFGLETFNSALEETAYLPWDQQATEPVNLTIPLTPNSTLPLFLVLGIDFTQQVNGKSYPLKNGSFNALSLIKVEGA
jgi:hypothetical protein